MYTSMKYEQNNSFVNSVAMSSLVNVCCLGEHQNGIIKVFENIVEEVMTYDMLTSILIELNIINLNF